MLKIKWIMLTLVLGAAMVFAGCSNDTVETNRPVVVTNANTAAPVNTATAPATGAAVEPGTIVANPNAYIGQTVTIVGEVEEIFGPRAFTLDEETIAGNTDLLVLAPQNPAVNLEAIDNNWLNDGVRITGAVRRMVVADVERDLGWDLDNELEVEYRDRPVVILQSLSRTVDR